MNIIGVWSPQFAEQVVAVSRPRAGGLGSVPRRKVSRLRSSIVKDKTSRVASGYAAFKFLPLFFVGICCRGLPGLVSEEPGRTCVRGAGNVQLLKLCCSQILHVFRLLWLMIFFVLKPAFCAALVPCTHIHIVLYFDPISVPPVLLWSCIIQAPPQAYCCAHPRLFLRRSPGVLHSHPCQLGSAAAGWIRAVLWEEPRLMQAHRMYSQQTQAASTLNQDYFKISFKLHSEEISTWRMSLGEMWKPSCSSHVEIGKVQVLVLPELSRRCSGNETFLLPSCRTEVATVGEGRVFFGDHKR